MSNNLFIFFRGCKPLLQERVLEQRSLDATKVESRDFPARPRLSSRLQQAPQFVIPAFAEMTGEKVVTAKLLSLQYKRAKRAAFVASFDCLQ